MSKSYRKPYAPVTGVRSAAHDKMVARRCWRRAQEQAIRDCRDWEELVIPKRLEASFNDVWSWGRDGNQILQSRSSQYNNPFSYVCSPTWMTTEEIMERWEDHKQRDDDWMMYVTRK